MTDTLNIALAQQNPVLGDIDGNIAKIRRGRAEAKAQGADLVIYSELNVCGYPPEDLVLKPAFQEACESAVTKLAAETADGGPALLVGSPWREDGKLYNAAVLLDQGARGGHALQMRPAELRRVRREARVRAEPAAGPGEFPQCAARRHGLRGHVELRTVTECLAETGAEILMLGNGSPYEHEKQEERIELAVQRVKESSLPIIYVNQVGGQDELVFDGASFVVDGDYSLKAQLPAFSRDGVAHALAASGRSLALRGRRADQAAGWSAKASTGDDPGPARLCGEEPLPRRAARSLRRHRFRDHGGRGRGCARAGSRARGHDAVALHQPRKP